MSLITLFLNVAVMMMLLNVASISSICTSSVTLEHISTIGNSLVLCDNGRKIYVEKLPDRFLITVHNCNGNFDGFALKALDTIPCSDGLVHKLYLSFQGKKTDLVNYYAIAEIYDWY